MTPDPVKPTYIVLRREVRDDGDWFHLEAIVQAHDGAAAIRDTLEARHAAGDTDLDGYLVAVPERSFRVQKITVEIHTKLQIGGLA